MSTKSALLETLAPFGASASEPGFLEDLDVPRSAAARRQRILDTVNRTYLPRRIEIVNGDAKLDLLVQECQIVGVSRIEVPAISEKLVKVLTAAKIWRKPPASVRKNLLMILKKAIVEFVKVKGPFAINPEIIDDPDALPATGFTLIELGYVKPEAQIIPVKQAKKKAEPVKEEAKPAEPSPYGGAEKLEIRKGGLAEQYFESTSALSGSAFLLNGKGEVAAARKKTEAEFPEESGQQIVAGFQNWATLLANELPGPHQIIVRSYEDEGDCYSVLWDGEAMSINSFKDDEIGRVVNSWLIAKRDQEKKSL